MRKIINGRAYDTTTARLMAVYRDGSYKKILYKKKNAEFFFVTGNFKETTNDKNEKTYEHCESSCFETKNLYYDGYFQEKVARWVEKNFNDKYEEIFGKAEE